MFAAKHKVTEFLPVLRKGIIILGQEQDALGDPNFFDENQAFCGELSQVEFWSLALVRRIFFSIKNSNVLGASG